MARELKDNKDREIMGQAVLVIDDNTTNLRVVADFLEVYDLEVMVAQDGESGLEKAEFAIPDLILLDILLPGIDGFETCRRLKQNKKTCDIPVIFMTALTRTEDKILGFQVGAVDYITKPIQEEEMLARVNTHLKLHELTEYLELKVSERTWELQKEIKERKQAELNLQLSEERLHLAIEGADLGMWDWDIKSNNLYFSPRYLSMLGYGPNELPHTFETFERLLHPEDREQTKGALLTSMSQKDTKWSLTFRLKTKNKKYRWIIGRGKVVEYDQNGKPTRASGTHLDITDQKQGEIEKNKLEKQLRQTYKMEAIGILAGGIAHDFNNILSSIFGFTELVKMNIKDDEKTKKHLDQVLMAGIRARDLVGHILTFSRQAEVQRRLTKIEPLIKECLKFLLASFPKNINIRHDLGNFDTMVLADPSQIHQIIMNLCTNAAHSMTPKGGVLDVSLKAIKIQDRNFLRANELKQGKYLKLAISDSGCGISAEIIERIFEPFFTTKERGEGTGMGLSTVHGIVKDMGGAITVNSGPDKGTIFEVFLPEHEGKTISEDYTSPFPKKGKGRILLVDDEKSIVQSSQKILERLGYEVIGLTDSLEAFKIFKENAKDFDLILTDRAMPGMDGLELSKKLKSIKPDIPIVLCTGFSQGVTHEMIKDIDIFDMVMKPMIVSELAEVVSKALKTKNK